MLKRPEMLMDFSCIKLILIWVIVNLISILIIGTMIRWSRHWNLQRNNQIHLMIEVDHFLNGDKMSRPEYMGMGTEIIPCTACGTPIRRQPNELDVEYSVCSRKCLGKMMSKNKRKLTLEQVEYAYLQWKVEKRTRLYIAEELNVSDTTLIRYFREYQERLNELLKQCMMKKRHCIK